MPTVTLKYKDSSEATFTQAYTATHVRGIETPDEVAFRQVKIELLNGTIIDKVWGWRRRIMVRLAAFNNLTNEEFIFRWARSENKYIVTENSVEVYVSLLNPEEFGNEWINENEYGKSYTLLCEERTIQTSEEFNTGYGMDYGEDYGNQL